MSVETNTILMEKAREQCEYWTGSLHERLILRAIEGDDLEALQKHIREAEAEQILQEEYEVSADYER